MGNYGNGAGFALNTVEGDKIKRHEVPSKSLDYDYQQPSGIPLASETHGGGDVGIWAKGPMSHFFHTVHEQAYIGHVMSYAACIGPHKDSPRCKDGRSSGSSVVLFNKSLFLFLSLIFVLFR